MMPFFSNYLGRSLLTLALLVAALPRMAGAEPLIAEFLASNNRGLTDADGDASDWIEIHNPDEVAVDLADWSLTDSASNLRKWVFPAGASLAPGGSLVVFASGKDRRTAGQEWHTNFSLSADGEYLALVKPDGTTRVTEFVPAFPPQREDVSYGFAQRRRVVDLVGGVTPEWLVPTAGMPFDWNGGAAAGWLAGEGPGAIGYDTTAPALSTYNAARVVGVVAEQSSGTAYPAARAIDGSESNFTQTLGNTTDPDPWWQVTLAEDHPLVKITLVNRTTNRQRLRDITVRVLAENGVVLWTSPVLNPGDVLSGPATLEIDLAAATGGPLTARQVRVSRAGDPLLATNLDRYVLSLAEVTLDAVFLPGLLPTDHNLARDSNVTATQSSTLTGFAATQARDGDADTYSQTNNADTNARWTLNLRGRKLLSSVTLHNRRGDEWASRLRDITVSVRDADNTTVVFTSPLLNPGNAGFTYPRGPEALTVDLLALAGGPVFGQYVEIKRTPDPDLSGSSGVGTAADMNALALTELEVFGQDPLDDYRRLIVTDVQTKLHGANTSVLVRLPFTVNDKAGLRSLRLRVRGDDGFVAWLNGVEVARRRAPDGVPAWNAAATAEQDAVAGQAYEIIDLTPHLAALADGANLLALHGLTTSATAPAFLLWPELLAEDVEESASPVYLTTPTPGAMNDSDPFAGWVGEVAFSASRGFYTAPFTLTLASSTPDAEIYYTLDAEDPTPGRGTRYTEPLAISGTSVVRARAYKAGWAPTPVATQTYLFLTDVIGQAADGRAPEGWPATWGSNAVDYGMDPAVRTLYGDEQMIEALRQIPALSIVTPKAHLFDAQTGIYANSLQQGRAWERPASIEMLDPQATPGSQGMFQIDAGLRIRGGYSRNAEFRKHSFRIYFRRQYGEGKLRYPLFGTKGADQFDVIDLASSQNYSWARDTSGADTMLRDPLARETQVATGSPGSRTRYFHLYLDGLYWGLYWFDERPSAGYGEAYFGGNGETWDVVKTGNHSKDFVTEATEGYLDMVPPRSPTQPEQKSAWRLLWEKSRALATATGNTRDGNPDLAAYFDILGRDAQGVRDPAKEVLVDADSLINYLLNIFWTGDGDAPLSSFLNNEKANNWFCLRDRADPNRGFVFITHDAEHTFGASSSQTSRVGPYISASFQNQLGRSNPQWVFQDLCYSPEFRIRVADLAHRHLLNGGVMTADSAKARLDGLASQINLAVKAHAQRWGDAQKRPAFNASNWTTATNAVRNYLTNRANTVLGQLRNYRLSTSYPAGSAPLYPRVEPPAFSQHGGEVGAGFALAMTSADTATGGVIHYTLDGGDPRLVGGAVSPQAAVYAATVPLPQSRVVKARVLKEGQWSALTEAAFVVDGAAGGLSHLVVSALLYKPTDPTPAESAAGYDADDFEYLELANIGALPLDLTGVRIAGGIDFTFGPQTLEPGALLVLAANAAALPLRHPGVVVAGQYTGKLSNSGEQIILAGPDGAALRDFAYSDTAPWPSPPDTAGHALVLVSPRSNPDHADPLHWRASLAPGGTPGAADSLDYAAWKTMHQIGDDEDDADADGLPAWLEFALGTSPSEATPLPLQLPARGNDGSVDVSFTRRPGADEAALVVETSADLETWTTPAASLLSREESATGETLTLRLAPPVLPASASTRYFRLRADRL